MDPHDTIREQLKAAQSRGVDALRDRLGPVLDDLERAISALREAQSEPADQLFPLAELETAVAAVEDAAPAAAPAAITLDVIRRLDAPRSQSELLHELLSVLIDYASRAVVLVVRSGDVTAWSGVGFADGSTLQQWTGDVASSVVLSSLARDPQPLRFDPVDDPLMSEWFLGVDAPQDALLVPVTLRDKLMGAVYADRLPGGPWDPDTVQVMVAIGCWLIDTLHHRTAAPTPMLAEATEVDAEAVVSIPTVEPEVAPPEFVEEVPTSEEAPEFEVEPEVAISVEPEPVEAEPPPVEEAVVAEPPVEEEPVVAEPLLEEEPVVAEPPVEEEPVVAEPLLEEEPVVPEPPVEEEPRSRLTWVRWSRRPPRPSLHRPRRWSSRWAPRPPWSLHPWPRCRPQKCRSRRRWRR
jgi:hypothetical protein